MKEAGRLKERDEWVFEEPETFPEWQWVLEGFSEVSTDRQIGSMGGSGPVPFTAIDRYAEREGMSRHDYRVFLSLARALDAEYLTFQAEESKRKTASRPPPMRGRRG